MPIGRLCPLLELVILVLVVRAGGHVSAGRGEVGIELVLRARRRALCVMVQRRSCQTFRVMLRPEALTACAWMATRECLTRTSLAGRASQASVGAGLGELRALTLPARAQLLTVHTLATAPMLTGCASA